ncbi:unnamed protein product [Oikopleura dioica]|uniref:RING-type domain-containing protein n=1 Tax=Oikopleura dioica TaxID=34765 RepID=E4XQJ7_OIKDI|nr:unnamed protein product [Oikopleura dioica]
MVVSIPLEYVYSWGSVKECNFLDSCDGSGLTETMMQYNGSHFYCTICYEEIISEEHKNRCIPRVNDAKFKCPEKNCESKLYFHQFVAGKCCDKAKNKTILENGLSTDDEHHRTEFQDLKKMMNLLELSEQEERIAKEIMDSKAEKYEMSTSDFNEKKTARKQSRTDLASLLKIAGTSIDEEKENTERLKLQELRKIMDEHETAMNDEEISEKKMEEDKKSLDQATSEFMKKKEKREQVQSDLSLSFSDSAENLVINQEERENQCDKCNVCFEKYNKIDRHSCSLKCGHLTCRKCLGELTENICPICREPFTEENIIKIYLR